MCIIIAKPKDVSLDAIKAPWLHRGNSNNPHGIGVMWAKDGKVHIKKDFADVKALMEWMVNTIEDKDALAIHFRFATSGLQDEGNRHPFPVIEDCEAMRAVIGSYNMAMMHNGVISKLNNRNGRFSDTMLFNGSILSHVKDMLHDTGVQSLISEFIGNDRLLVMESDGTMIRWGNWTETDGIMFSNNGHLESRWHLVPEKKEYKSCHRTFPIETKLKGKCEGCHRFTAVKSVGDVWLCKKCRTGKQNDIDSYIEKYHRTCCICSMRMSVTEMRKDASGKWRCRRCDALSAC